MCAGRRLHQPSDVPRRPPLLSPAIKTSSLSTARPDWGRLPAPPAFGKLIEVDAEDDDQPDDDRLVVGVDVVDRQTAVEHADQQRADERAQDAAFTTEETGAADDDGGDHN